MPEAPRDPGLRKMMTWTLIALIVSLIMAAIGVGLAIHYFDRP
jgi:preprotein translocase subunit SecY